MNELTLDSFLRCCLYFVVLAGSLFLIFFGGAFLDGAHARVVEVRRATEKNADSAVLLENGREILLPDILARWIAIGDRVEKKRFTFLYVVKFPKRVNGSTEMHCDRSPSPNGVAYIVIASLGTLMLAYKFLPGIA